MAEIRLPRNQQVYEQLVKLYPEVADLWKVFLSLNEVPRPSGHTAASTQWAAEVGRKLGAEVKIDAIGNIVLRFPATPGFEDKPVIVLQGHLDMVGTKKDGVEFDFTKDTIVHEIIGDELHAVNTTLGADDGSGVAAALALVMDKKVKRGPVEVFFTIDEETGLVGAQKLKEAELLSPKAKYLINIDSEDFGEVCVSCAGSVNRAIRIPTKLAPHTEGWAHMRLRLTDFKGGHTGVHIHMGRANALKWACTMLSENEEVLNGVEFRIANLAGGNAHNAVPSLTVVDFAVPADKAKAVEAAMRRVFEALCQRWAHVEAQPKMEMEVLAAPTTPDALTFTSSRTVLRMLESLHHGIWRWSEECPSLVESSQSVSKAGLQNGVFWVEVFARSSKNEALAHMAKMIDLYAALYGGVAEQHMHDMPGWPADPESKLCKTAEEVFQREFGHPAKVVPIHAGLECGIIINKYPANKLEAISIGPTVKNPHTINEFMELKSCVDLYHYLVKIVEALCQ